MFYTDPGQPTTEDEARLLRQAMTPLHGVVEMPEDGPVLVLTVPVAATFAAVEAAMDKSKRQTGRGLDPTETCTTSTTNR